MLETFATKVSSFVIRIGFEPMTLSLEGGEIIKNKNNNQAGSEFRYI